MDSARSCTPAGGQPAGPAPPSAMPSRPGQRSRRYRLFAWLSVLALASLSYVLGAAVMFFQLPSSGFLSKGFIGGREWSEQRHAGTRSAAAQPSSLVDGIDKPGKSFDGFTLFSCFSMSASSTQILLINMRREVVHRWTASFSSIWPESPHLETRHPNDADVCIFACHLYGNGDLLVVFHGVGRDAAGYGLVKLDKDSNVLWKYAATVHHDVEVGEDGTIYTILHSPLAQRPSGLESYPSPWLVDYLVMLSPDGKEVKKPISILEALRQSPYSALLSSLEKSRNGNLLDDVPGRSMLNRFRQYDVSHTNTVKVLGRALAPKFPMFKAGQVLLTIRNLNALAVLDPDTGSVVWAVQGPWQAQHDAQFLDNGRLLLFDNLGSPRGSRVLEYDPQNDAFPWSYPGTDGAPFFSSERGLCQRLGNGNTFIVDSEGRALLEVSPSKEVVWSCSTNGFITTARRYAPDQLSFLKAGQRARP
jgi:hypothetical protein